MERTSGGKRATSIERFDNDDASSPVFTLGQYELEELSLGRAAKLLRGSKSRSSKLRAAADMRAENMPGKSPILLGIPELRPFGRPAYGYEVEEIEPKNLPGWMFEKEIDRPD